MKQKSTLSAIMALTLSISASTVFAHSDEHSDDGNTGSNNLAIIDFESLDVGAVYGKSNVTGISSPFGVAPACGGFFNCYEEDGFLIGTPNDELSVLAHVHRSGNAGDYSLEYHNDSAGIYIRKTDSSAFALESFDIEELSAGDNFTIVGFSEALNDNIVGIDINNIASASNYVTSQSLSSSNIGEVILADAFHDIKAFWLVYSDITETPSGAVNWDINIDNIKVSDVSVNPPVSHVPVPAAVYFFASGLMGLFTMKRKKAA